MRAALLVLFLVGCACQPEQVVVTKPVEVQVPVVVACKVADVPVPEWETDKLGVDAPAFEKARAAVAELAQRMAYEIELKAALDACRIH